MMTFDAREYEEQVLKPLRGADTLPDDLLTRYAVDPTADRAALEAQLKRVRRLWNQKASAARAGNLACACKLLLSADDELRKNEGENLLTPAWWQRQAQLQAERHQLVKAVAIPEPPGLARTAFGELRTKLAEAHAPTIVHLLYPNLTGKFQIVRGFRLAKHPEAQLDEATLRRQAKDTEAKADSRSVRAKKSALALLSAAVSSGTELRAIAVYHLADQVHRKRIDQRLPDPALISMLSGLGLDRDDAVLLVASVPPGSGPSTDPDLLEPVGRTGPPAQTAEPANSGEAPPPGEPIAVRPRWRTGRALIGGLATIALLAGATFALDWPEDRDASGTPIPSSLPTPSRGPTPSHTATPSSMPTSSRTATPSSAAGPVRFLRAVPGHTEAVYAVAFSPDGTILASGSADGTVRLSNPVTGALLGRPLIGHSAEVAEVAFSPDGKTLASASYDHTIRLWSVRGHTLIGEPLDVGAEVHSVAFSPDGKTLAAASDDHTVQRWSVGSHTLIGEPLTGHTKPAGSVAFSPDGTILASASADRTVRRWNAHTGAPFGEPLAGHTDTTWAVAFSPNGKILVSGSDDRTIRRWNPVTGAPLGAPLTGHTGAVGAFAFSSDGKTLVSGSADGTVRLWNPVTGASLRQLRTGTSEAVYAVAFSPDGKTIAAGSGDHTVKLWAVSSV